MSSLEYRLVKINDEETYDPSPEALALDPKVQPLQLNGKVAQSLGFDESTGKLSVVTFDSDIVNVDEAKLQEYEPVPVEEGGFDVAYPATDEGFQYFVEELSVKLAEKNYCVVQMSSRPAERLSAQRAANLMEEERWTRVLPEFETQYMGRDPMGKKVLWPEADEMRGNGLEVADLALTGMAMAAGNVCPNLGFEGVSRTNGMIHVNCASRDEEDDLLDRFKGDGSMVGHKTITQNLNFSQRKKLCMMYFLHGSGGTLTLHPAIRDAQDISLTCNENQVIIFRHDICDYTYAPMKEQVALQSWILREAQTGEITLQVNADYIMEDFDRMPKAPRYGNSEYTCDCMSLATRLPGVVNKPEDYWNVLGTGVDALILIPVTRWDYEVYFEPNADAIIPGKCYTRHIGFLTYDQMASFDNEFFGLETEEATRIDPPARNLMEVAYDCLYRAGWTRELLKGAEMGGYWGYAGTEYVGNYVAGHYGFFDENYVTFNAGCTGSRLHYTFGMTGPCLTLETACSSSLYATGVLHSQLRPQMPGQRDSSSRVQIKQGLAAGSNGYFDPWFTISLASAHMLSVTGRCYTFNSSADGYARGEGTPVMYYKLGLGEDVGRLAVLAGTCMNQDGRSASMTAPNGPSQQECIRHSLREAHIGAFDIQIQELHGTGTSLGDPIEVGALRATMMRSGDVVREFPLVKSSSKSNIGHTELSAGICGILKCVLMGLKNCAAPNVHLKLLNPHIDDNEYPVYFASEYVEQGCTPYERPYGFHGVSSFGFSGCNARGDIWARALSGPANTQPGRTPVYFTRERVEITESLFGCNSMPPYLKTEEKSFKEGLDAVYNDAYLTDKPNSDDNTFYVKGSWNPGVSEEMVWREEENAHVFAFKLGETLQEQFDIVVDKNKYHTIFPAGKMADKSALILGPGIAPSAHKWLVNGGKKDGAMKGTVYAIKFIWDEPARLKRIWWGPCEDEWALDLVKSAKAHHTYAIAGTWNADKPTTMREVKGSQGASVFEFSFRIGPSGHEDFKLMRDSDPCQAIYPAGQSVSSTDIYVCGPDHMGDGKSWRCIGSTGARVQVQLTSIAGKFEVTTKSENSGTLTWKSKDASAGGNYYVTASWNNDGFSPMVPDPDNTSVYTTYCTIGKERFETFQVILDQDKRQALHPEMNNADSGQSRVCGPDGKGGHLRFAILGEVGAIYDIQLDLAQEDPKNIVTWTLRA